MKNFSLLFCLCFLACQHPRSLHRIVQKTNADLPGQTAPNDMIFVAGNGDIAPFYISASEEPNINYIIYLLWLESVFGESYPEAVKNALPKSPKIETSTQYVDAFIDAYLTNPAYAYYPVINLNWEQIENYLSWKTDRLNEYILIKNGILNFNSEQKDEDNFNSEAYLVGQYQGDVRKNLPNFTTGGERSVKFNDGILFTGFRLPTEEEWDYVAEKSSLKKKAISTKRKVPFHPYGKDYYTLLWGKSLESSGAEFYDSNLPIGMNTYTIPSGDLIDQRRNAAKFDPSLKTNFPSIYDFDPKSYGVINMENGVQEWLLNEYQDEVQNPAQDWLMVLQQSGIIINNPDAKDERGHYVEKDYLGKLRNFRFIDVDANGNPYEVERYGATNLSLQKLNLKKEQLKQKISSAHQRKELPENIQKMADDIKAKREEQIKKLQEDIAKINDSYTLRSAKYRLEALIKEGQSIVYRQPKPVNIEKLKTQLKSIEAEIAKISAKKLIRQRLVKGGDWKNPGKQRRALAENEAAANVGFRVILPYTGAAVSKKYKVSWGGSLPKIKR